MGQSEKISYSRKFRNDKYNLIWHFRFTCCITMATDTRSVYMVYIAFPRQMKSFWEPYFCSPGVVSYLQGTVWMNRGYRSRQELELVQKADRVAAFS